MHWKNDSSSNEKKPALHDAVRATSYLSDIIKLTLVSTVEETVPLSRCESQNRSTGILGVTHGDRAIHLPDLHTPAVVLALGAPKPLTHNFSLHVADWIFQSYRMIMERANFAAIALKFSPPL